MEFSSHLDIVIRRVIVQVVLLIGIAKQVEQEVTIRSLDRQVLSKRIMAQSKSNMMSALCNGYESHANAMLTPLVTALTDSQSVLIIRLSSSSALTS